MTTDPLQLAEQALRRGDLPAARQLASSSTRPEAHQFLAMVALRSGEVEPALEHLNRYLEIRPQDPDAWFNLGLVQSQRGDALAAVKAWQRALTEQPTHLAARVNLGQLLVRQGEVAQGLEYLKHACAQAPDQPAVTEALSEAQLAAGRPRDAMETARQGLSGTHNNKTLWLHLAQAQMALDDLDSALDSYAKAAADGDAGPVLSAVQALIQHRAAATAQQFLSRYAVSEQPDLMDAQAAVLKALGDREGAISWSRRALEAAPASHRVRLNLASHLSGHTDPRMVAEAAELAGTVLKAQPRNAGAAHCLALVYQRQGALPAALDMARRAVALSPSAEHCLTLGDTLALIDPKEAVTELRAAVARYPESAPLHRQLGIACLRAADTGGALDALDESMALDPGDQRTIAHRAVAMSASGSRAEADNWLGLTRNVYAEPFKCPDGFDSLDEFNRALAADIANHSRMRWEPLGLAARNGGLTDDLTADATPAILGFETSLRLAIETLRRRVVPNPSDPFLREIPGPGYQLNIWATYVRDGGQIDTHIHEESWLSGAYYVQVPPGRGDEGAIEFGRPHADLPQVDLTSVQLIHPTAGQLLLFPGYLFHRTIAHRGDQPRISVSFDVTPR